MGNGRVIEALRETARALRCADGRESLRVIQQLQDRLDAEKAELLAAMAESQSFEVDGASSVTGWARRELRLPAPQTKALITAAATIRDLPAVAEAADQGLLRVEHLKAFSYGIKHIGLNIMVDAQDWLLDVAVSCEPNELRRVIRALREAAYPDSLDRAWAEGMDKQDITVNPVPEGFHLNGFLSIDVGAKFRALLDSLGAPRDAGDPRTASQRRVEALDQMLDRVLASGLPADKGVRPHISVMVDADTLQAALDHNPNYLAQPAGLPGQLIGHGPIGPKLLGYLACNANLTAILIRGNTDVLDVGRTRRLATNRQRIAVLARQHHTCAAPGCVNTHLEIHHAHWWTHGGPTNLDNLIGLCTNCHRLVHRGLLSIRTRKHGQFTFTSHDNRPTRTAHRNRLRIRREIRRQHAADNKPKIPTPLRQ